MALRLKSLGLASDAKPVKNSVDESVFKDSSLATSDEIAEAVRLAPYVDLIQKNIGVEPIRDSRVTILARLSAYLTPCPRPTFAPRSKRCW